MFRRALALVSTLSLFSGTGCSWAFMTKAPDPVLTPNEPIECTNTRVPPVLDALCAAYVATNAIVLAGRPDCNGTAPGKACYEGRNVAMGVDAGLVVLCLASSVSGFGRAQRCQAVTHQNELCIGGNDEACRALSPGWRPAAPPPTR